MNLNENGPDLLAAELALERLRGSMEKNFAQVQGKLDMLMAADERMNADVASLEVRVSALEKRVWLASGAAGLVGLAMPFVVQALGQ